MSFWCVDPAKAGQLNLRKAVAPAEIIAVLAADTVVEKLAVAATDPDWWQVRVTLGGTTVTGFVNSSFLRAVAGAVPGPAPLLAWPACHLPSGGHRRRDAVGQAFPLDEPVMPARTAPVAVQTLNIIAWLSPDTVGHARYQPGGGKTFCNIYAYDFCQRMGVYLPRVWWTAKAIVALSNGQAVAVSYANTVTELNANALHDWCEEFGPEFGWRRVFTETALQAAANAGQVAIIVAKRKDTNRSGHIVAVVPETAALMAATKGGAVVRPVQSQAGSVNFTARVPATRWWLDARFRSFGFWVHE